MTDLDKAYTAKARFGAVSDTLDAEGEISPLGTPLPARAAIEDALTGFTGDLLQVPPMTSALKRDGQRLYDLHRRGITVEREPRPVTVNAFRLTDLDPASQTAEFEISCSSGTYVRTLVADLATHVGTGAYLTALRRTSVGALSVQNASPQELLDTSTLHSHIIPPVKMVSHLPVVEVSEDERRLVCHGRKIVRSGVEGSYRVMCGDELLGVYRDRDDEGRAEVVLCAA